MVDQDGHRFGGGALLDQTISGKDLVMSKADRLEFEERRAKLDHWGKLSLDHCIMYGLTSKSKWLAEQREKEE